MAVLAQEQLQNVAQAVQGVNQAVQEMKSSLQAAGMISKDQSSGKANIGFEDVTHDIGSDEAFKSKTYNDGELWTFDKKQIAASEQTERVRSLDLDNQLKQIELARKQHDLAHQQKLDNLHLRDAEQASLFKHALNMEYAKFNAAASEPISPNTGK